MRRVHLCTGILERDGAVLLVASRYPNHRAPLWNLPGGRPIGFELRAQALEREFLEETGLEIAVGELAYVSESFDRATATHFTNTTFRVEAGGEPQVPFDDAHVVELAWVPASAVGARLSVAAVREPLVAHLGGDSRRYFGFAEAGITIEFADDD